MLEVVGHESLHASDPLVEVGEASAFLAVDQELAVAESNVLEGGELSYDRSEDPEADLTNLLRNRAALATTHPDFVPGVVSAMRASAEINDAMQRAHTTTAYREILTRMLRADHPHLALLAELAPAIIVHRTIFGEELDPEAFSQHVLALIHDLTTKPNP